MVQTILGPDHDLAKRLSKMERDIAALNTRDVLQNATFGPNGMTVAQAFAQLQSFVVVGSADVSGFTIPPSGYENSVTLTVPANMTKCSYTMVVYGAGLNSTASAGYLTVYTTTPIAVSSGVLGPASYVAYPTTTAIGQIAGLTAGAGLTFTAGILANPGWAASAQSRLRIQVLALFQS